MGAKNLIELDPYAKPNAHPAYFYPLTLTLDPEERLAFQTYFEENFKEGVKGESLYSPMPNAIDWFPKTVEKTDQLLAKIGLKVRAITIFASDGNSNSVNIHVDGTKLKDDVTDVVLEARLSYYMKWEYAPGSIRWFPKTSEYIKQEVGDNPNRKLLLQSLLDRHTEIQKVMDGAWGDPVLGPVTIPSGPARGEYVDGNAALEHLLPLAEVTAGTVRSVIADGSKFFNPTSGGKKYGVHWLLPWIQDLYDKKITWEDCPDYIHATSTNVPSAILRTNIPHHVIQGPGPRLTISCQLVFIEDRNPVGVWAHISKHYKQLGIPDLGEPNLA